MFLFPVGDLKQNTLVVAMHESTKAAQQPSSLSEPDLKDLKLINIYYFGVKIHNLDEHETARNDIITFSRILY